MPIHNFTTTLLTLLITPFLSLLLPFPRSLPQQLASQSKVFVFIQRTDAHAKYSKSEVFHDAMNDLMAYLKEKNVAIAVDEFGGRNFAESATPLDTVFKIARDSDATSVLYFIIDRPVTKWIKITARCIDMNQKLLWKEEASNDLQHEWRGRTEEHRKTYARTARSSRRQGRTPSPCLYPTYPR